MSDRSTSAGTIAPAPDALRMANPWGWRISGGLHCASPGIVGFGAATVRGRRLSRMRRAAEATGLRQRMMGVGLTSSISVEKKYGCRSSTPRSNTAASARAASALACFSARALTILSRPLCAGRLVPVGIAVAIAPKSVQYRCRQCSPRQRPPPPPLDRRPPALSACL